MNESLPQSSGGRQLDPDQLGSFVDFLNKSEENKRRELDLQDKDNDRNFQYSIRALDVQADDRNKGREFIHRRDRYRFIAIGVYLLLAISLIVYLVEKGKDDMAEEILKAAAFLITGAIGGYGVGTSRKKLRHHDNTEEEPG